jgi:hypothetical protein
MADAASVPAALPAATEDDLTEEGRTATSLDAVFQLRCAPDWRPARRGAAVNCVHALTRRFRCPPPAGLTRA